MSHSYGQQADPFSQRVGQPFAGRRALHGEDSEDDDSEEDKVVYERQRCFHPLLRIGGGSGNPSHASHSASGTAVTATTTATVKHSDEREEIARGSPAASKDPQNGCLNRGASLFPSKDGGCHAVDRLPSASSVPSPSPSSSPSSSLPPELRGQRFANRVFAEHVDPDVLTMGATVRVPPALHASAARQTLLDVLLDMKKRAADERSRAADGKDLAVREASGQQRRSNGDSQPNRTGPVGAEASPAVDPKRSLRHLLPSHLKKEERQRAVERAVERQRQLAAERAMACEISDYGSSSGGNEDEDEDDEGRSEDGPGRAPPAPTPTPKGGSPKKRKRETVLSLLRETQEDGTGPPRGRRSSGKAMASSGAASGKPPPPRRSVADLFDVSERRAAAEAPLAAERGAAPPTTWRGVRASDLVDEFLTEQEEKEEEEGERAARRDPRRRGDGTGRAKRGSWSLDAELFAPILSQSDGRDAVEDRGEDNGDDGTMLSPSRREAFEASDTAKKNTDRTRKLDALLDDGLAAGAALAAQEQQTRQRENLLRAQQQHWLQVQQELRSRGATDDEEGEEALSLTGRGIVGKPANVYLTSAAAAAGACTRRRGGVPDSLFARLRGRPGFPFPGGAEGDGDVKWFIPKLLADPQRYAGADGGHTARRGTKPALDNSTAIRIVDYLRRSFDMWLLDGGRICREIQWRADADAAAAAAREQVFGDVAVLQPHPSSQLGGNRSSLSAVVDSALELERPSRGATGQPPQQREREETRGRVRSAAVTLEGSGVDVKIQVESADTAYGVTRIVGVIVWMSFSACRKCGGGSGEERSSALERPPGEEPAPRWTVVLPEHLYSSLPLSMGHYLYLAEPLFAFAKLRVLLASYCVTTDVLVAHACEAYEALLFSTAHAEAGAQQSQRQQQQQAQEEEGAEDGGEAVESGLRRAAPSLKAPRAYDDPAFTTTPEARRDNRHRRRRRRRSGSTGSGSEIDVDAEGVDGDVGRRETSSPPHPSASLSRTPFRGTQYDPLAFPGITVVGGGGDHGVDVGSVKHEPKPIAADAETRVGVGAAWNKGLAGRTAKRLEEEAEDKSSGPESGDPPRLRNSDHSRTTGRSSSRGGTGDTAAQRQRRAVEQEEAAVRVRAVMDSKDPAGVGFRRGPGPGWDVPLDVVHLVVSAAVQPVERRRHGPNTSAVAAKAAPAGRVVEAITASTLPSSLGGGSANGSDGLQRNTSVLSVASLPPDVPLLVDGASVEGEGDSLAASSSSSGYSLPSPPDPHARPERQQR